MRSFYRDGDKQGKLTRPREVAFDKNNNVMVVDTLNSLVQLFSEQGENLSQFGCKRNLDHQLDYPHGLSVDNKGNIIVADRYNKSIKIFSPDDHYLCKFRDEGSFPPSLLITYNMTNIW